MSYSRVCGRLIGYQKGSTRNGVPIPSLEGTYIDGVSLTHGTAGSRQHIWTFVAAVYETNLTSSTMYQFLYQLAIPKAFLHRKQLLL